MRTGQLRSDLYYRLQASVYEVPPLRERIDDVPLLIEHFINVFNERLNGPFRSPVSLGTRWQRCRIMPGRATYGNCPT